MVSRFQTHALIRTPLAVLCCLAWHFGLLNAASAVAGTGTINDSASYAAAFSGLFNGIWASWLGIEAFVRQRTFWTAFAVAFALASAFFGALFVGAPFLLGAKSSDFNLVDASMIAWPATTLAIAMAGLAAKATRTSQTP